MLKLKKLIYDSEGNVCMSFKHYDCEIKVRSRPDDMGDEYKEDVCSRLGELFNHITHCKEYNKTKAFEARRYRLEDYLINPYYKWFVRKADISDDVIKSVFKGTIYFYNIEVIVCKYGIGLYSLNSLYNDEYSFSKVSTLDPKKDLLHLVNEVIGAAYDAAAELEPSIFSRVDSIDDESINF